MSSSEFFGFDDALAALGKDEPIIFIEPEQVELLHEKLLNRFGGLHGVRDRSALAGACARPLQIMAYGDNPSITDMAASLCAGIVGSHPFIDGNKRSAFTAMVELLNVNGYSFKSSQATVYNMMIGLASGAINEPVFADWVQSCSFSSDQASNHKHVNDSPTP